MNQFIIAWTELSLSHVNNILKENGDFPVDM
jgi:hypothetical protein